MAMNSTIEGPSSVKLYDLFNGVMSWIYQQAESDSLRLRSATGKLMSQLTQYCP